PPGCIFSSNVGGFTLSLKYASTSGLSIWSDNVWVPKTANESNVATSNSPLVELEIYTFGVSSWLRNKEVSATVRTNRVSFAERRCSLDVLCAARSESDKARGRTNVESCEILTPTGIVRSL